MQGSLDRVEIENTLIVRVHCELAIVNVGLGSRVVRTCDVAGLERRFTVAAHIIRGQVRHVIYVQTDS